MVQSGMTFWEALWATRAGNVFTTHTAVAAGFDMFAPAVIEQYFEAYLAECGIAVSDLLGLGRTRPDRNDEPFNMAYLALRGARREWGQPAPRGRQPPAVSTALSALGRTRSPGHPRHQRRAHAHVGLRRSRPAVDSACGKDRWLGRTDELADAVRTLDDEALWGLRVTRSRQLITYARARAATQLRQRGVHAEGLDTVDRVLDPGALTLGFARRSTDYNARPCCCPSGAVPALLPKTARPVQIIVAGKAHPADEEGKRQVQAWMRFIRGAGDPDARRLSGGLRFALARQLVQGVDVWVNDPRRPWEACGPAAF